MALLSKLFGRPADKVQPAPVVQKSATNRSAMAVFLAGGQVPGDLQVLDMDHALEQSSVVYSCCNKIARDISGTPLLLLRKPDDADSRIPDSDPLARLMNQPNPWFTGEQFMAYCVLMLMMRGEFFVVPDDVNKPKELFPYFDAKDWREQTDRDGRLIGWSFRYGTMARQFPIPGNVLHHRLVGLAKPYRGLSPLQSAARTYGIDTLAEKLQLAFVQRGGERGTTFKTPENAGIMDSDQYEQMVARLMSRVSNTGDPMRPAILEGGVDIVDPKLTQADIDLLALSKWSEAKITQAFGMSPGLIGRDDSANYVETFKRRDAIYWRNTVVPIMRGIQAAFDRWFGVRFPGVFFRFDLSGVESLQADFAMLADNAVKLHTNGVPWSVIEARLGLGLDVSAIPAADEGFLSATAAPVSQLLDAWEEPSAAPDEGKSQQTGADRARTKAERNSAIRRKAANPRAVIQRNRRLLKLETGLRNGWRNKTGELKSAAKTILERAMAGGKKPQDAREAILADLDKLAEKAAGEYVGLCEPYHRKAAAEGVLSIAILLDKADIDDAETWHKAPVLSQAAQGVIRQRQNYIKDASDRFFRDLKAAVSSAVIDGETSDGLFRMVADEFNGNANRAATIARMEVGTAYMSSRFVESEEQGFGKGEWLANNDELTRETHKANEDAGPIPIGTPFPNGCRYPMDPSADIGETANCRCDWIPVEE